MSLNYSVHSGSISISMWNQLVCRDTCLLMQWISFSVAGHEDGAREMDRSAHREWITTHFYSSETLCLFHCFNHFGSFTSRIDSHCVFICLCVIFHNQCMLCSWNLLLTPKLYVNVLVRGLNPTSTCSWTKKMVEISLRR